MRARLAHNVDKQRGFVNGTIAEVEHILGDDVFVAKTKTGLRLPVHPITYQKRTYIPFCYGYATTIRRSQGSTLDQGCLWFDHNYPADPGYAYVGASRFERAIDVMLMGKFRVTDWIPVCAEEASVQVKRSAESEDTMSDSEAGNEDLGASCDENSHDEDDPGASPDQESTDDEDMDDPGASASEADSADQNHEDQGACAEDSDTESDQQDYNADAEQEAVEAEATSWEQRKVVAVLDVEKQVVAPEAMAVTRGWFQREGVAGPFQQMRLQTIPIPSQRNEGKKKLKLFH